MVRHKLRSRLDPELVIQEAMYGCIMALTLLLTARIGLIHYESRTNLILAILGMDIVWAIIDMYIFYRVDIMSRNRALKLYWDLRDCPDRESKKQELEGEFEGTVFDMVSKEDQDKMIDVFLDGTFTGKEGIRRSTGHYLFNALTAFVTASAPAIPPVLCLMYIEDFDLALIAASVISSLLVFFVGYYMSPGDTSRSRMLTGLTTAGLCLFFTVICAAFGG